MDIKGLNMAEISQRLAPYIEGFFKGSKVNYGENGLFAESYLLGFDEIKWLLPEEYHTLLGGGEKYYNGASDRGRERQKSGFLRNVIYFRDGI